MIDAERMLGSLVRNALTGDRGRRGKRGRRKRRRSSTLGIPKSTLAMGALGAAIAAFEHFSGKDTDRIGRGAGTPAPPPSGSPSDATPAPPSAPLPPLPSTPSARPAVRELPPIPRPSETGEPDRQGPLRDEATLLIQAMIAAARADGELDTSERARILDAVIQSGASEEDRAFLLGELDHPKSLAALAARATTPDMARQVYLASRMAIDVDTDAEARYLAQLAERLGLSAADVDELDAMLDAPPDSAG